MVGDNKDHGHAAEGVGEGCELVIGHHLVSTKLNAKEKMPKGLVCLMVMFSFSSRARILRDEVWMEVGLTLGE